MYIVYPILIAPLIAVWLDSWIFEFDFEYSTFFTYLVVTIIGLSIISFFKENDVDYLLAHGREDISIEDKNPPIVNRNGNFFALDEKGNYVPLQYNSKNERFEIKKSISYDEDELPF